MTHWYSPSTGAFGLQLWGKKKRPTDAVDVSAQEHAALFPMGEPQREIEAGPDGKPRWKTASIAEQRAAAIADVKREAGRRIEAILPLHKQINALRNFTSETDTAFITIDEIRHASNLIELDIAESEAPAAVPIKTHPLWPDQQESKA